MSQVTEAFCRQILAHVNSGEHAQLTIGEQRQLAYAWLELNRLGTKAVAQAALLRTPALPPA